MFAIEITAIAVMACCVAAIAPLVFVPRPRRPGAGFLEKRNMHLTRLGFNLFVVCYLAPLIFMDIVGNTLLSNVIAHRKDMVEKMASDLIAMGAPLTSDRAAIMALTGRYRTLDVALLAGTARMVAFQECVAKEMGDR
jgi:hypothetical protein